MLDTLADIAKALQWCHRPLDVILSHMRWYMAYLQSLRGGRIPNAVAYNGESGKIIEDAREFGGTRIHQRRAGYMNRNSTEEVSDQHR